jgi:hypothetical protein
MGADDKSAALASAEIVVEAIKGIRNSFFNGFIPNR